MHFHARIQSEEQCVTYTDNMKETQYFFEEAISNRQHAAETKKIQTGKGRYALVLYCCRL